MTCNKGYMWNTSTCECQCDTWCKPGQYLDHKNCLYVFIMSRTRFRVNPHSIVA